MMALSLRLMLLLLHRHESLAQVALPSVANTTAWTFVGVGGAWSERVGVIAPGPSESSGRQMAFLTDRAFEPSTPVSPAILLDSGI